MYFTPTLSPKETSGNVRDFVEDHRDELIQLMKSVLPFLILFVLVNSYVQYLLNLDAVEYLRDVKQPETMSDVKELMANIQGHSYGNPLTWVSFAFQIGVGYCFAVVAVGWHRLVLLGRNNYTSMSFLNPKKHEIEFVIMWTVMGTILPFLMVYLFKIDIWLVILLSVIFPYLFFKVSFYFPAKALDSNVSLISSFQLTNGYFFKFLFAMMRSCILVAIVYALVALIIGSVAASLAQDWYGDQMTSDLVRSMYEQMVGQPVMSVIAVFIFQPIFTVLGVTVLSNYFQHAMQNKSV
ncbi:MAG: hypothetical protein ACRBB3_03345 [Alphaproteobacteria bacterium]